MRYRLLILFISLCSAFQNGHSQFVDIRIDLSTYNEVKIVGEGRAETKNGVLLQWLGISVLENIELGVGVKYHNLPENEKRQDIKVLNDNSSDFSRALSVNGNYIVMPVCLINKPSHEKKDPSRKYTAWIGFPARQISELFVEYN